MIPQLVVGIIAVLALSVGGYFVVKEDGARTLAQAVASRFESGEYLAALGAAEKLKESGRAEEGLDETISQAARFLVAEDTFGKAKQAAAENRWNDARALLRENEAFNEPAFKYAREAKELLAQAEALTAKEAHETAVTISSLKNRADSEEKRRKTLEGSLQEKEKTLTETRAESRETKQKLEASQKEAEAKQAELLAEQARAKALMEQVEKESRQKFFAEFKTYRDLAEKGRQQLEDAIAEIAAKRDVTALLYLSQGRVLFDEAKGKSADLRARAAPAYQGKVDDLIDSLAQFLEAAKWLRNAAVYLEDQSSADFTGAFSKGKETFASASNRLSAVSDFMR